jgi:effector-binding domain-containing protein
LAETDVATTLHIGPYEQLHVVYADLAAWITAHGYVVDGPVREVYLNGPDEVASPDEFRTEVRMPIRSAVVAATT